MKKTTKKGNPVGKGKVKVIAKRPTKSKTPRVPEMGDAGKIVFKRFGM